MNNLVQHACTAANAKAMQVFDRLNSIVNIVIGAANTMAGKAMFDAIERIKATPLYRHNIKHELNTAARLYYKYEHLHIRNFGGRTQLFYDYLDKVEEDTQKHVDILRMSIKAALDRYRQTDTALKSYIETARTLLEYACRLYDIQIDVADRQVPGLDFNRWMYPARLTGVLRHFENVSDMLCRTEGDADISLNADRNIRLAFEIIERKLTSEDFLNKAAFEALALNPECRKYISGEDYRELKEKYAES